MNVLSDWSVRNRTGAAFGVLLLLLMILGVCSYLQMGRLQANVRDMGALLGRRLSERFRDFRM